MKIVCIGGGAASFFFAVNASALYPEAEIIIMEQGKSVLGKVLISGGGRCNVTHNCFDPKLLVENYPRGRKELLGPFYYFGPQQTVDWFESFGVPIVAEEDGRMFPLSNSSESIANCLTDQCSKNGVKVWTSCKVTNINPKEKGKSGYDIELLNDPSTHCDKLFIAPGSSKQLWQVLEHLGHTIVPPVPSLFTFKVRDSRIDGLPGVSIQNVHISIPKLKLESTGPLLITHKGLSGPSILKMSSWGARKMHEVNYQFDLHVDFRPDISVEEIKDWRISSQHVLLGNHHNLGLPKRLCISLLNYHQLDPNKPLGQLSNKEIHSLTSILKQSCFTVLGHNRFKEEFVTAGGVQLYEIDFSNFSSKLYHNMHLAGEVLNIDAVTGGFNFQAAWTGAYIAAHGLMDE